jgi:hypothetical protein
MDRKKNHKNNLKVLPVKNNSNKILFPQVPFPLLQPPFTLCEIAPTKSGKSVRLCNYLLNSTFGYNDNVFDEIIYCSPTLPYDKTLEAVFNNEEIIKITDEDDLNNLDEILKDIIKSQREKNSEDRKHVLVVLDDCIQYLKKSKVLSSLPSFSRHYLISCIVVSQVFKDALPMKLRKNCSGYVIGRIFNRSDIESIENEIGCNYESFLKHYQEATNEPYSFLFVDQREVALYKNFDLPALWAK